MTAAILAGGPAAATGDGTGRGLLWRVVQTCVANARLTGAAFPCLAVDIAGGVETGSAVVRAPLDKTHVVLTPTARIEGVESQRLHDPSIPNYFAAAWRARRFVEEKAPRRLRRQDLAMAINSKPGRSQDQLHIHVDCVAPDVRDELHAHAADIRLGAWSKLSFDLRGDRYWAMRVASADLRDINLFQRVALDLVPAEAERPKMTIAAVGAVFEGGVEGFYLLAAVVARGAVHNQGHAEFLLDQDCTSS